MTFYTANPEPALRFGDIVTGFICATPTLDNPPYVGKDQSSSCHVEISSCPYYAIVTPCCSIENSTISLCPLQPVKASFLKNAYFAEDVTRINRPVVPDKQLRESDWVALAPEEKAARIAAGPAYTFLETYFYSPHDLLAKYKIKVGGAERELNCYMIDFRAIFQVKCKMVQRDSGHLQHLKVLQLSLETRAEMREKMTLYFSRVPEEDQAVV